MDIHSILEEFPLPLKDPSDRGALVDHLRFVYGIIVASEPLLEMAIQFSSKGLVRDYYGHHLSEERHHAQWLEADLRSIGVEPLLVHWNAARIAGTQYYLVRHVDPVMLLGYIAALECRPANLDHVAQLECLHGTDLLRTYRYHAEHDRRHGQDVVQIINQLDERDQDLVYTNTIYTAWSLSQGA